MPYVDGFIEKRDAVNAAVMADERMKGDDWKGVFDGKRMIYGGFRSFVGQ